MNQPLDQREFSQRHEPRLWIHLTIAVAFLSLAAWMDITKPLGKSWTILYLLPVLYLGWKTRGGRLETGFFIAVTATTFLVPMIFRPQLLWGGTGIFNRILGALLGSLIIFLIWERRRYVRALEDANEELERRVASRVQELQRANAELAVDIDQRQRAEQQLRESEARFRTFVDHATGAFFLHDENGIVRDVNQQACDNLGYSRTELIGMSPMQFDPVLTVERMQEITQRLQAGETVQFDSVHRRKDGSEFPVAIRIRPFLSQGKRFRVALAHDISERKLAEQELRESEQRFREFSEAAFEGLLIHQQGIICDANRAFVELFGIGPLQEMIGRHCLDIFPLTPESREVVREQIRLPRDHVIEISTQRSNGTIRHLESQSRPIQFAGGPARVVAVRDITERKRAEEERRRLVEQTQQAQTLESLGVMAGGIAHDFNNLLTVINGNCHLLRTRLDENDSRQGFAAAIQAAGGQAAKLMRQLLLFSRGIPQQPEVLNVKQVIEQSVEIWQKVVGDRIQVILECDEGLWPVTADRSQIEQVLLNLVLNARDAMAEGGRILVRAANVELPPPTDGGAGHVERGRNQAGKFVQISVEDTGTGMTDKIRARIFEPFFTTKNVGEGAGLGLPMCHGIVRQAGGWIEVRSEPGSGSTFCIVIPVASNFTPAEHVAPSAAVGSP